MRTIERTGAFHRDFKREAKGQHKIPGPHAGGTLTRFSRLPYQAGSRAARPEPKSARELFHGYQIARPFMVWWNKLPRWRAKSPLAGQDYQVAFILYSADGKRAAEVRESRNGETYLSEQEWVRGTTFRNRHSGKMVGPFASPQDAEKFIVATAWFGGRSG